MKKFNQREKEGFREKVVFGNIPYSILEEAVDWITQNCEPEDIFNVEKLEAWAEDNGFKK